MRKGASKSKGNKFENDTAKMLGVWYYNDRNAIIRTPSSGALLTVDSSKLELGGDLLQIKFLETSRFPFSVECKHHKLFTIAHLLFESQRSRLWKGWQQCLKDAEQMDKVPLFIFKGNYQDAYVATKLTKDQTSIVREKAWHYVEANGILLVSLNAFIQDPLWLEVASWYDPREGVADA